MGFRKFRSLLVMWLAIFSIFTVSSAAQGLDSFYSLLCSHGLPIRILPPNITTFTVDESSDRFEVYLNRSCSAKFENEVHYEINVIVTLTYGQIGDLYGMSAQPRHRSEIHEYCAKEAICGNCCGGVSVYMLRVLIDSWLSDLGFGCKTLVDVTRRIDKIKATSVNLENLESTEKKRDAKK